jgi:hypothetical protein
MKIRASLLSLTVALGLAWGLLWLLGGAIGVVHADPVTPRYVSTIGVDTGNCDNFNSPCLTVQYAIDVAVSFDPIKVAGGTYTDTAGTVATISESIKLSGGWNAGFTIQDPDTYTTTLDAQGQGWVVEIVGDCAPPSTASPSPGATPTTRTTRTMRGAVS